MAAPACAPPTRIRLYRLALFLSALLPLAWMGWAWQTGALGVIPEERLMHLLGRWGLAFLLITLALGPGFRLTRWRGLIAVRRQLGLWAFAYLLLHALVWAGFDQGWMGDIMLMELRTMRPLQIGLASLAILVPLAVTSVPAIQRRMTVPAWLRLHRLAYLAAAGGVLHAWMMARFESQQLWLMTGALLAIILARLLLRRR